MPAFYTLPHRDLKIPSAALRISGPDANTYLQGQFTQDVKIGIGKKVYGLWLNQKGKVLADSHILRLGSDEHLVFAPRVSAEILRARLEAYLIADEVEIEDVSSCYFTIRLWGDGAMRSLASDGSMDSRHFDIEDSIAGREDGLVFATGRPSWPAFTVLAATGTEHVWVDRFSRAGFQAQSWTEAERARIAARVPAVPDDIGSSDLPNEGDLEQFAISYTKGCYLGQEVMSRLRNLGQVRRKLHVVRGPGEPPPRGMELFQAGARVGECRSAARDGGGFVAFAMLSLVTLNPASPLARASDAAADIVIDHG